MERESVSLETIDELDRVLEDLTTVQESADILDVLHRARQLLSGDEVNQVLYCWNTLKDAVLVMLSTLRHKRKEWMSLEGVQLELKDKLEKCRGDVELLLTSASGATNADATRMFDALIAGARQNMQRLERRYADERVHKNGRHVVHASETDA